MTKTILIIGSGISGLSLAYYWYRKFPTDKIMIFEQKPVVGGVIGSIDDRGVYFDKGPKTLRVSSSQEFLDLVEDLGIKDELIFSSDEAKNRYLYLNQKMVKLPTRIKEILFSKELVYLFLAILKEPFIKKSVILDETIGDFARRRFGKRVSENFIQPFIMGIVGADMDQVCLRATFPILSDLEKNYGSILLGFFKKRKKKDKRLVSLKKGVASLIQHLEKRLAPFIYKDEKVLSISASGRVITEKQELVPDHIFCASSLLELQTLTNVKHPLLEKKLYESLTGISLAFEKREFSYKGFGYLVPKKEKEKILGVIFDSQIFQNEKENLIKMTVLMKNQTEDRLSIALEALKKHLGFEGKLKAYAVFDYPQSLFSYPKESFLMVDEFKRILKKEYPMITLCGNYLHPPGVNQCIKYSLELVEKN